jgi:4-hydroxy-3-polyprenylbenzoate decarboxylase/2,5-furandicarboxylate decarboxylase 1
LPFEDLRSFLAFLEKNGELLKIEREIKVKYEIAAGIRKISNIQGPALSFENVKGYDTPVVGGVFATRRRALLGLEMKEETVFDEFLRRIKKPIKPKFVDDGPCKEVVLEGNEVDLLKFPIPIYSEGDAGPYITVGVQISKDPETGSKNAGIYRMQVKGKNKLGIMAHQFQDISIQFSKAEKRNEPLEVATAIGLDPVIPLASQVKVPYGVDELGVAGGLRKKAVEVVKCKTVDLEVPATAEMVIEGKILPNIREPEAPFGEFTGYMGDQENNPVVEVTAITHREDPIHQACLTGTPTTENHILKEIPYEVTLYDDLKGIFPEVKAVNFSPAGGCQLLAIVSLNQRYKGEAKNLILTSLGHKIRPKCVIVVDDDIDVFDHVQVLWAVVTRSQPVDDIITLQGVAGGPLDPSTLENDVTSVMGIDATRPFGEPFASVVNIPGAEGFELPQTKGMKWSGR